LQEVKKLRASAAISAVAELSRIESIQPISIFIGWMKGVWGKRRSPRSRGKIKGEIPLKERGADRDRATV